MKIKPTLFLLITVAFCFLVVACQETKKPNDQANANANMANKPLPAVCQTNVMLPAGTPTEAYRSLYEAVQRKDYPAICASMTRASIDLIEFQSAMSKKPFEEVLKNGLIEGNLSSTMPEVRDERIKDNYAALEVKSPSGRWDDVGFMFEEGRWKVAVGDQFKGSFQSPGNPKSANTNTAQIIEKKIPTNINGPNPIANANVAPNVNAKNPTTEKK
jgi:hypothetical protein